MSISDELSLHHLISPEVAPGSSFLTRSLLYLTAISNGYKSSVDFDTQELTSTWVSYEQSVLRLPLIIKPGSGAFITSGGGPNLAFKNSITGLFSGVSVRSSSNLSLVETRDSNQYSSALRMFLEKPGSWTLSNQDGLLYENDYVEDDIVGGLVAPADIATPSRLPFSGPPSEFVPNRSKKYNIGFEKRRALFLNACSKKDAAEIKVTLNIPLVALHSFFESLNFPMVNARLFFSFYLNTTSSGSSYKPMVRGTYTDGTVLKVDVPADFTVNVDTTEAPQLSYHALTFSGEQSAVIAAQLESGFTKRMRYDLYDVNQQTRNYDSKSIKVQIASNVVGVKRVYALVHPAGLVDGIEWPSPLTTGSLQYLDRYNVFINNQPYHQRSLDTLESQWKELTQMLPMNGYGGVDSALTFSKWKNTNRICVVDVTRDGTGNGDRSQPASIMWDSTLEGTDSSNKVDITFIIQRTQQVVFHFGAGKFRVEVGAQLFR